MPAILTVEEAPQGWRWIGDRHPATGNLEMTSSNRGEALRNLETWAEEGDLYVSSSNRWTGTSLVFVNANAGTRQQEQEFAWRSLWCRYGVRHGREGMAAYCHCVPDTPSQSMACGGCGRVDLFTAWCPGTLDYRCWTGGSCGQPCEGRVTPEERLERELQPRWQVNTDTHAARYCVNSAEPGFTQCLDHDHRQDCFNCGAGVSEDYRYLVYLEDDDRLICQNCWYSWCSYDSHFVESGTTGVYNTPGWGEGPTCRACRRVLDAGRYEEYDDDGDEAPPESVALTPYIHRPIRTCSIEMETVNGGATLATALARAGLSSLSNVQGYGSSRHIPNEFCHVERDSSLGDNGGELIFDRVRLDDPEDAGRMHAAMQIVRTLIKNGDLAMSMSCGLHVHVDAHQMGVGDVRNLVLTTNYLEDVLYRMSAAKYTKHRGTRFSQPLPKGPYPDRRVFGVQFLQSNGHESALNVSHYWQAMRNNCRCGAAIVGTHEECTCNLGKCTFEFRYFNGTANFRKVQAYSALCQSLVSYAKLVDDLDDSTMPVMGYNEGLTEFDAEHLDKWDERLRWMLANLYFSDGERDSLNYVSNTSALAALGADRLADIFETAYVPSEAPAQVIEHRNPRGGSNPSEFPSEIDWEPEFDDEYRDGDYEPQY